MTKLSKLFNIFNKLMMDLRTLFESSDVANNSDYNNSNIIENKKKYDEDKLKYLEIQQEIRNKINNKRNLFYHKFNLLNNNNNN